VNYNSYLKAAQRGRKWGGFEDGIVESERVSEGVELEVGGMKAESLGRSVSV